jgi:hypothetical protein
MLFNSTSNNLRIVVSSVGAHKIQLVAFVLGLFGCLQSASAACDFNATSSNFSTQLAAAAPGQTICLATGNYGTFNGMTKTSPGVTLTAAPGATPTMALWFGTTTSPASWLILDNITIAGGNINGPANNITFRNSHFTDKLTIWQNAKNNSCSGCPALNNSNIVFDNDLFDMSANQAGVGGYEGRIQIIGSGNDPVPAGVTIKNSKLTTGCADGIQIGGGGYGVTIGPNNEFYNLLQGSCGPHIDSIQFVGTDPTGPVITGNYFHDNTTGIIGYDYANDATITNNVLKSIAADGTAIAGNATGTISHNTLINNELSCGVTHQGNVCHSAFINNIATGFYLDGGGAGAPSALDFNLCTKASCPSGYGTHNLTGTPTYVGGTSPTTYSAFPLTSSSIGHNAANDGNDIGINVANVATAVPSPPTNLIIVSVQ